MPNGPWVKHSGTDPGPMASAGLGPSFEQRGWNHEPYFRVEVYGPSGLGDLVPCYINGAEAGLQQQQRIPTDNTNFFY